MTTFVLVHGAWHGAWCWERLVPELGARGHDAVTMDLPVSDGTATLSDYAHVVTEAAAGTTGDVVLVGHSLGAAVLPLVAARRPAAAIVFLCGVTPNLHGHPWDDAPRTDEPGTFDPLVTEPDGTAVWPDVEGATAAFYNAASPDDAAWAFARLRPQNSSSLWTTPYPLSAWPDVPVSAISCTSDRVMRPEFVRASCRDRFGIEPVEIPGDHSPFLSRPAALADLLVTLTLQL